MNNQTVGKEIEGAISLKHSIPRALHPFTAAMRQLRSNRVRRNQLAGLLGLTALVGALAGCGGGAAQKKQPFFTSGSREADQRATQTMAKAEQLSGSGEGAGEKEKGGSAGGSGPVKADAKLSLFERLGGDAGLKAIVEDFTPRALQDPRVNWDRKGVQSGGLFHKNRGAMWNPTPQNVATFKQHMVQFLALASGGPAQYQGREMKSVHKGMDISNPEFDAAVGDLKATLDKLKIANQEQKELLAILESTRPEIVTQR